MNMDPVVHISHLSIQCYTCMMETENVVYLNIIQFVIVIQDGKDHNVSNPIIVSSNRVKTKVHAYKRDLLTHQNDNQFLFDIDFLSNHSDKNI
jgi:hypothetical protein